MPKAETITCDVCGAAMKEDNHCLIVVTVPFSPGIAFAPIGTQYPDDAVIEYICGQTCMHKRLSQWVEREAA
jgi:hypothetical protein